MYVLMGALALAGACGDDGGDEPNTPVNDASTGVGADSGNCGMDTYQNYAMSFFSTNCTVCHGANAAMLGDNVRLDSLALVKQHKEHVIEHAVELMPPIMPSGSTTGLPEAERLRLKAWYDCGAP